MSLLIRTLFVWLLMLAIPAQGMAAATMAFCGLNHHGGGSARAEVGATVSKHTHHGDAVSMQEFDADVADAMAVADDVSALVKASQATKQKCSVCVSCCSLGALLSTLPDVPATDSAPTEFITLVPTVDAFAADGPDRPPRNVLV
ncbi:hypothetical protein D621_21655 [beta proteobacterium AAP51]|nr:hypothetical protein D621_21655 [beta proteobacterium AAP51]